MDICVFILKHCVAPRIMTRACMHACACIHTHYIHITGGCTYTLHDIHAYGVASSDERPEGGGADDSGGWWPEEDEDEPEEHDDWFQQRIPLTVDPTSELYANVKIHNIEEVRKGERARAREREKGTDGKAGRETCRRREGVVVIVVDGLGSMV